jgi:hypothetical protein
MSFSLRKKIIITGLILACLISPGFALAPVSVQAQNGATQNNTVSTDTNTTTNTTTSSSSGDAKDLIIKIVGWVCVALVWTLGQILIVYLQH